MQFDGPPAGRHVLAYCGDHPRPVALEFRPAQLIRDLLLRGGVFLRQEDIILVVDDGQLRVEVGLVLLVVLRRILGALCETLLRARDLPPAVRVVTKNVRGL